MKLPLGYAKLNVKIQTMLQLHKGIKQIEIKQEKGVG